MTRHPRPLPGDAYLAELLGWSDEQLLQYQVERQQAAALEQAANPPAATCGPVLVPIIVSTILSVGFSLLSQMLTPKPRRPGEIISSQRQGETTTDGARYAPRPGFDSTQEVARLGSIIPITFARREFLPALNGRPEGYYGGCRVDLGLVWSQLVSLGGSQLFRGVYLLGEGPMAEIDPQGFAVGNNPLMSYDLGTAGANESSARVTIYSRLGGGRIRSSDRIAGRLAANDAGNAENAGGADVFQLRSTGGVIRPDACAAVRPSSSTACGLFATIGNGLGYRVNPQLRPTRQIATKPSGSNGDQRIDPVDDPVALGAIWKARRMWSGRSGVVATSTGVISGDAALTEGATFDYLLSNTSDALTKLKFNSTNTDADIGAVDHIETCSDVASAISGRQRSADDALVIGDLFKCGSCLAVLETRTPDNQLFSSDADNQPVGGGQTITARFRVVRAGTVQVTPAAEINPAGTGTIQFPPAVNAAVSWDWSVVDPGPRYATGTSRGHLHRVAVADFTLARPARMVEIGLRSTVGIRGSGFANLRQIPNLREINRLAGGEREGETLRSGQKLKVATFQTGSKPFSEERFAFFRLSYRAEATAPFVLLPTIYGVRGLTQQAQFNSLQLEMPSSARWQFRLEPISGWEIRSGIATGQLAVLDARLAGLQTVTDGAVVVRYVGEAPFTRSVERFALDSIEPDERNSVTALVTSTAGASPNNAGSVFTDVQLIQSGLDKGGRATVTVPGSGVIDSSAIAITAPGNGYDDSPITLVNGTRAGTAVLVARSFAFSSNIALPLLDYRLAAASDVPPPRVGSLVSFASTGTLPAPLLDWPLYEVMDITSSAEYEVRLITGGANITVTNAGTGDHTCSQWANGRTITAVDPALDRLTLSGAAPAIGTRVQVAAETTLPAPLVANTTYFVAAQPTTASIQISTTLGGAVLDLTTAGTGGMTARFSNTTNWAGTATLGKTDIGLGWSDSGALTDPWGKLAEGFVYDEIQTTAAQGPEHEIVYAQPIQTNPTAPTYANMALIGMNIRSALEFQSISQLSAQVLGGHICPIRYIEGTAGATHLLPDIFTRLALSAEFGAGLEVSADQINTASFLAAAQWCFNRRYFFDGTLPAPENLRQWAADQASIHLLAFYELNGQFYFKPALSFDPVPIVDLFTAANIQAGTFQSTTTDDDQRRPIQVSGLFRDERANDDILAPGMFSTVREITIREAGGSDSDPVEPLDLKASCTNRWHLIDAAKFLIRYRRLVGDPISFETTYAGMLRPIAPEDHIAVAFDETLENLYSNGAVMPDGTLVASEPLVDGAYEVLAWDGTTPPGPTIQSLVVTNGGTKGSLLGTVWTRTAAPQVRTYRVMRVSPTDDGRQRIEAVLMPTDANGRLVMSLGWDDPTAWVIRG
jgi:hypothetical protein